MILRPDFVNIESLKVRRRDGRTEQGAKCIQMVYFDCDFPYSRYMVPDLVPYTIYRSIARDIDIK